VIKLLDAGII
jgi:hypothetical protein